MTTLVNIVLGWPVYAATRAGGLLARVRLHDLSRDAPELGFFRLEDHVGRVGPLVRPVRG